MISQVHDETAALVPHPREQEITFPAPDDHYKLFTEVYHYLEALYYNTALALDKVGSTNPAFATSSNQRQDPALGLVVEMASSTPVMCEFGKLEKLLWARILANTMTHECHQFENRHKVSVRAYCCRIAWGLGIALCLSLSGCECSGEWRRRPTAWRSTCT